MLEITPAYQQPAAALSSILLSPHVCVCVCVHSRLHSGCHLSISFLCVPSLGYRCRRSHLVRCRSPQRSVVGQTIILHNLGAPNEIEIFNDSNYSVTITQPTGHTISRTGAKLLSKGAAVCKQIGATTWIMVGALTS